jgi:hypothetical protein
MFFVPPLRRLDKTQNSRRLFLMPPYDRMFFFIIRAIDIGAQG